MAEILRDLLPEDVALSASQIEDAQDSLFVDEMEAILSSVPKRQAEFRAGRTHARRALRALGCPDQPILRNHNRSPIWPHSFVGAITHSRLLAAAIAAPADKYLALGIDLEPTTPLATDLHALVARPEERAAFLRPIKSRRKVIDRGKLVFSIKEAVFKAYNPLTDHWLDFQDATITLDAENRSFEARLVPTVPQVPGHAVLRGRWDLMSDHVGAVLTLVRDH